MVKIGKKSLPFIFSEFTYNYPFSVHGKIISRPLWILAVCDDITTSKCWNLRFNFKDDNGDYIVVPFSQYEFEFIEELCKEHLLETKNDLITDQLNTDRQLFQFINKYH